ncbi:hypothetical protein HID58_034775 [Brassica napus]|uniref:Uncharacterized protein n=1 Tax=Brassica napus TaxID=3708 RepID=A0ABQ8C331_BRANA|nr:hypothetical protein HID58_034775 [Brassica napus]
MLQFWEAEKAQRGDELMGVDMLLFDVKISFHIRYSQPSCQPPCNQNFRLSDSLMTILFSDSTNLDVLTEPYSPIPVKRFRNVIGELTAVKSTKLEGFLGDPRVVVASSINPNMHMPVSKAIGITPVPSLLRSYAKVEPLTIAELNEFVIISEPQDIEFVCTGMVTDIKLEKGCNTTHQTIAGTSLSGRHQETLGIKVFKGGQEATGLD